MVDTFLHSLHLRSLSKSQCQDLNAPFTEMDIEQRLEHFPMVSLLVLVATLTSTIKLSILPCSSYLCSAFNHAMLEGTVPSEMLQATIINLPKPGKSPEWPANFRPTSLLNTDVK